MQTVESILEHCRQLANRPDYRREYLEGIKADSRGLVGYFSNYVPAEIIAAADFIPVRLIGRFESDGTEILPRPMCSFVQDVFATARTGALDALKAVVFGNSCDSLKALYQAWPCSTAQKFLLQHPINTTPEAVDYFASQLQKLAADLFGLAGLPLSEERLKTAVVDYNTIRGLIRVLYRQRLNGSLALSYADLLALITAGLMTPPKSFTSLLQNVVDALRQEPVDPTDKRIMIAGPLVDHLGLITQIEALGVFIAADDITNGQRFVKADVKTGGSMCENLAKHILLGTASPTLNACTDADFLRMIKTVRPDGVLFINQQHCEPHVHNYVSKSRILQDLAIPALLIETEHHRQDVGANELMRIESFVEMLNGG